MRALLLIGILLISCVVHAAAEWVYEYRPAKAGYVVYSGELGDTYAPTAKDAKITIVLSGSAARDMFNALGTDRADACKDEESTRVRYRDNIVCQRNKSKRHVCHIGFDLKTGKSIGGIIC